VQQGKEKRLNRAHQADTRGEQAAPLAIAQGRFAQRAGIHLPHGVQQVSQAFNRRLSFALNEKLDQVVVKVIDSETDKIIKEIPPAELQHVHERIREVIGILFDERA